MKRILWLAFFVIIILSFGCTLGRPTWTENQTFSGKGKLWEARIKAVYIERLIPKDKETYKYERTNEKHYEIKYLGHDKVKEYKYEIKYPYGSTQSGTGENNDQNPVVITGSGAGSTLSERSIEQASNITIGTGGLHLDTGDIVKVKISWDGQTEEFDLTVN